MISIGKWHIKQQPVIENFMGKIYVEKDTLSLACMKSRKYCITFQKKKRTI